MKDKRIEIPLNVRTDYQDTHSDGNERAKEQIEHAQLYLQSVFNFIRRAGMNAKSDVQNESEEVQEFFYALSNFCDIGNALCQTIWKNVSSMQVGGSESISEKISLLINDEKTPDLISEALQDALTDMFNASMNEETNEVQKSADYIERVLIDYENREAKR